MDPLERTVHCVKLDGVSTVGDAPPLKYLVVPNSPESLKIGRQNTPRTSNRITDGFFDSRVLSRNHAELFIKEGTLYIRDLKSSNGTFLNDEKLTPLVDYELKLNDKIDLGTTLESQMAHKKITCVVSAIDFISLDKYNKSVESILDLGDLQWKKLELFNTGLDAVLFGGIVDDNLLDLLEDSNATKTESPLVLVNQLVLALSNEHIQQQKLKAMAKFIKNYNNSLVAGETPQIWTNLNSEIRTLSKLLEAKSSQLDLSESHSIEKDSTIKAMESKIASLESHKKEADSSLREMRESSNSHLVFWGIGIGIIGGVSINYFIN